MQQISIFNQDITTAVSATRVIYGKLPAGTNRLALEAIFTYVASAATSVTAYVQTSLDGGTTWIDIANFAFTTSTASKMANLSGSTPVTTLGTPGDAALSSNTVVDGIIGDMIAVKYVTVGTYGAGTNLKINAVARS